MQVDVNSAPGRLGVVGSEIQERIKCGSRVCIQQRLPQSRLADFADGQVLSFISRVTETHFPVPRFEVVAEFSHLTAEPDVEERIPVGELFMSGTAVVNTARCNLDRYGETASVGEKTWNSRIGDGKGIKRILDWHTDAAGTKAYVSAWDLEWIGHKRHSCRGRIEE